MDHCKCNNSRNDRLRMRRRGQGLLVHTTPMTTGCGGSIRYVAAASNPHLEDLSKPAPNTITHTHACSTSWEAEAVVASREFPADWLLKRTHIYMGVAGSSSPIMTQHHQQQHPHRLIIMQTTQTARFSSSCMQRGFEPLSPTATFHRRRSLIERAQGRMYPSVSKRSET